jgi:hypothetical protein
MKNTATNTEKRTEDPHIPISRTPPPARYPEKANPPRKTEMLGHPSKRKQNLHLQRQSQLNEEAEDQRNKSSTHLVNSHSPSKIKVQQRRTS